MPLERVFEFFSVELVKSCVINKELIANLFNCFIERFIRKQRGYIKDRNVDEFFEFESLVSMLLGKHKMLPVLV